MVAPFDHRRRSKHHHLREQRRGSRTEPARLARVSGGRQRRQGLIDEEGEQTEIYVYPKEKGLVRFVASRHGAPDDQRIDVLLRLHDVVARFYAAIQQLAKDTIAFEQEWMFNFDPESVAQPPFISEVVEGFLSKDDTD